MGEENKNCPVCISPITNKAVIDTCLHEFCIDCIEGWCKTKLICPLCKSSFTKLRINYQLVDNVDVFEVKILEEVNKTVDESPADLSCLNDKYFLAEVNRLIANGENAMNKLFRKLKDNYGYNHLSSTLNRLNEIKSNILKEEMFNELPLLQELYRHDEILKCIWNGRIEKLIEYDMTSQENTPLPQRYSKNDYDNLNELSEEDSHELSEEYEDYY